MATTTVAFAGNPNSGKTTLFNALTGSRQHVGNYPGITVERKEGQTRYSGEDIHIIDLPGCYSLTAYTEEELVARKVLVEEKPDMVVDILDATRLERHLYLAVQFLELGVPVTLAVNMMDDAQKKGIMIDMEGLSHAFKCPVIATVARTGQGKEALAETILRHSQQHDGSWEPLQLSYGPDIDPTLADLSERIASEKLLTDKFPARWVALKYIEGDDHIMELGRQLNPQLARELEAEVDQLRQHCLRTLTTFPEAIIADYRYGFIHSLLKDCIRRQETQNLRYDVTDKLDRVLTHKLLGPLLMVGVLYAVFQVTFSLGEVPMGWLETAFGWLASGVQNSLDPGPLRSLLVSGIIEGVGGVLGFVPLIMIMFLFISFLEDSGYMARVAYMLDRVFRIFGLHGCSVMPFIISGGIAGGCAVPGVMAARTLRSPKEKLATVLTAPFMMCGAKIPVFILLIGAFFPDNPARAMFLVTLGAWVSALLVSRLLRSTIIRGESTPFVMELPAYRWPTLQGILIHTWERTWEYIKKAGTVILAISILLWAAMTYPHLPQKRQQHFAQQRQQIKQTAPSPQVRTEQLTQLASQRQSEALQHSIAGRIGQSLTSLSQWAGFDWRTNIALVGGFAAKEVIVSTLGTAYSLGAHPEAGNQSLGERIKSDPNWNPLTAISAIIFVLLYAPCFVTVVTIARETSWRWALFAMGFNTALAFVIAASVYQIGQLFMA